MSRRAAPEDALQLAVIEFLNLALPPSAVWWATPNGGHRNVLVARKLKALGVKAGIPDLFVLYAGRLVGIELKAPPAVLRDGSASKARPRLNGAQTEMIPRLAAAGSPTLVCRSVGQVEMGLRGLGVSLRGTIRGRSA